MIDRGRRLSHGGQAACLSESAGPGPLSLRHKGGLEIAVPFETPGQAARRFKKSSKPAEGLAWQAGRRAGRAGQGRVDGSCSRCDATRRRYKAGNLDSASGCDRRAWLTCFSARPTVWERVVPMPARRLPARQHGAGGAKKYRDASPSPSLTVTWYLRRLEKEGVLRGGFGCFGCKIINFVSGVGGQDWSLVRFEWRAAAPCHTPPCVPPQLRLRQ
jgi:hypothetical protein